MKRHTPGGLLSPLRRGLIGLVTGLLGTLWTFSAAATPPAEGAPRAALFVQNNAGPELDDKVAGFRDLLAAHLTSGGLAILDPSDIAMRFEKTPARVDDPVGEVIRIAARVVEGAKTESSVEETLGGASALRIAQLLEAQFLIIATFVSADTTELVFKGSQTLYKTSNSAATRTLRTAIRVLEGERGGSVLGDTVAVSSRVTGNEYLQQTGSNLDDALVADAARKIGDRIKGSVTRIRQNTSAPVPAVEISLTSNVEGATVAIDDAVIGTAPGRFMVKPGLHTISVSKERYGTWRKTVNIIPNQTLHAALERTAEGEARHAESLRVAREEDLTREGAAAAIAIAREQSAAEAYEKKAVAAGEREFRRNSHTRIEGEIDQLTIEPRPESVIKLERE